MTVRVRFAPSPTGHLHIGGVRSALFNYLFAKHHGGEFLLRIEDTDLERNVPGAEEEILRGFHWLGFDWAEGPDVGGPYGPYRCTERLDTYTEYLKKLEEQGIAYPCFCTPEELAEEREKAESEGQIPRYSGKCRHLTHEMREAKRAEGRTPNYRFAVPTGVELNFTDLVRGDVSFLSDDIGDYVIVKSNGIPTYNFQVVIDDALMKITHVIRGEEHLSNTPRQILVYRALGFDVPTFAHLPQVLDRNRKKLSKRDPNVRPVHAYRELGFLPESIVNFLALLGWSPVGEEEILSMQDLIERFDLDRVNKSGAIFDVDKLNWMAGQYMKQLPIDKLLPMVQEQLTAANVQVPSGQDSNWLATVVGLYHEQMQYAAQFVELAHSFFVKDIEWDEEALVIMQDDSAKQVIQEYRKLLALDDEHTADASRARFKKIQQDLGVKGKGLFMPVRSAIMGTVHGPDLQQSIACLPKDWILERIDRALGLVTA